MSIFAGIFARRPDVKLPVQVIDAIRLNISRSPEDAGNRNEYIDNNVFIVKVDIGAYGEVGHFAENGLQGFVAGAPLLSGDGDKSPKLRSEELQLIAQEIAQGKTDALRASRGQYCAVVYEQQNGKLHLIVDKLGVRPIYCWISPDYIVFSTALRIIEALPFCKKSIDLQGLTERACFGYSLADRTPYKNVIALRPAEMMTLHAGEMNRQCYWRWDKLPPANDDYPDVLSRVYGVFRDSVRLRLRGDKTTASFLSGGLDSRSIVAMLRELDVNVLSISYGPSGSQDEAFAALAADKLGSKHTQLTLTPIMEGDAHSKATLLPWIQSESYLAAGLEHPRMLWSGDGGSVGMGHVYINSEIVSLTREGKITEAAKRMLSYNRWGIQTKLFKPNIASSLDKLLLKGMEEEIKGIHATDTDRTAHLFFMLNDQCRHMTGHFENIDLGRVDFHVPFFDSELLAAVLRESVDPFLRHQFYIEWLKLFSAETTQAPWQAYPGHVPCPLPMPEGLSYQWSRQHSKEQATLKRKHAIAEAALLLEDKAFVAEYMSALHLRGMRTLMQFGMSGREYLLASPMVFRKYWRRAQGK